MAAIISHHLAPVFNSLSSSRVINAGKSMLNEDQASCEKLFVKKLSGKHKNNSTLQEDNGVSGVRVWHAELKTYCDHKGTA